jgi:transposase-like protein
MSKYRTFTAEFKAQVVMAVLTGDRTIAEVCRLHQLSDTLFYRWKTERTVRPRAGVPGGAPTFSICSIVVSSSPNSFQLPANE